METTVFSRMQMHACLTAMCLWHWSPTLKVLLLSTTDGAQCTQVSTASPMWLELQRHLGAACVPAHNPGQTCQQAQQRLTACTQLWQASGGSLRSVPSFVSEGRSGTVARCTLCGDARWRLSCFGVAVL